MTLSADTDQSLPGDMAAGKQSVSWASAGLGTVLTGWPGPEEADFTFRAGPGGQLLPAPPTSAVPGVLLSCSGVRSLNTLPGLAGGLSQCRLLGSSTFLIPRVRLSLTVLMWESSPQMP